MVEIEQEELERLRETETRYNSLLEEHNTLRSEHETLSKSHSELKDDYIKLCKGQVQSPPQEDDFDALCSKKFDRK